MQAQYQLEPVPIAQVCGILITIWQSVQLSDLLNAVLCAATGTVVSFIMTLLLKQILNYYKVTKKTNGKGTMMFRAKGEREDRSKMDDTQDAL